MFLSEKQLSRRQIEKTEIRFHCKEMEIEKMGERSEVGAGPLLKLGRLSSCFIKDSLRIARLAFVDVSAAEM